MKHARDIKFAKQLPVSYLHCRDLLHAWKPALFVKVASKPPFSIAVDYDQILERTIECARCGTTRIDFFARRNAGDFFHKIRVRYHYPQQYRYKAVDELADRPTREDFRNELFERQRRRKD